MNLLYLAVATALALVTAPTAPVPTPTPVAAPSVAQLCLATGVEQVDALLDGVAETQLVGDLAPLLDLTVPRDDGLSLDVDLDRFRSELDCGPTSAPPAPATTTPAPTPDPTGTPDPTPAPTAAPIPTTPTTPPGLSPLYPDCAAARAAGVTPIIVGDLGYDLDLDSDGDGIACDDLDDLPTTPRTPTGGFSQVDRVPAGGAATGDGSTR